MTAREAAVAAAVGKALSPLVCDGCGGTGMGSAPMSDGRFMETDCGDCDGSGGDLYDIEEAIYRGSSQRSPEADAVALVAAVRRVAAIIAALDTPTVTETGTYPCCSECGPGCSGRHESRCHCQTAELLAIADEGAARARGAL